MLWLTQLYHVSEYTMNTAMQLCLHIIKNYHCHTPWIIIINLVHNYAVENSLSTLNITLEKDDPQETLKALQNPDANFPFVYRDKEADKYHKALIEQKKCGMPQCLLVRIWHYALSRVSYTYYWLNTCMHTACVCWCGQRNVWEPFRENEVWCIIMLVTITIVYFGVATLCTLAPGLLLWEAAKQLMEHMCSLSSKFFARTI